MLAQNIIGKKLHSHHRVALCQSPIILYLQQDLFQFYSKILCNASVIIYENTSKNVLLKKKSVKKYLTEMKINTSVEKYGLEVIEPVYLKQNLPPLCPWHSY